MLSIFITTCLIIIHHHQNHHHQNHHHLYHTCSVFAQDRCSVQQSSHLPAGLSHTGRTDQPDHEEDDDEIGDDEN